MRQAQLLVCLALLSLTSGQTDLWSVGKSRRTRFVVGTCLTLTSSDDANFLKGLQFWVDQTNSRDGGIHVGEEHVALELLYYNDDGDAGKAANFYDLLVFRDKVDAIMYGGAMPIDGMMDLVNRSSTLTMVTGIQELPYHPLLFQMHGSMENNFPKDDMQDFVRRLANDQGVRNVTLYYSAKDLDAKGMCDYARHIVMTAGGFQTTTITSDSAGKWKQHIQHTELLIACTHSQEEAGEVLEQLTVNGVLYGWDSAERGVFNPALVETPTSLKSAYFMDGVASKQFFAQKLGWVDNVIGSFYWAPELNFSDPYFGSSLAVNLEWARRGDYGAGEDMEWQAAASIGTGVVLQRAIQIAQSVDTAAVAAAMRGLKQETVYGLVEFDAENRNTAHRAAMFQWQCGQEQQGSGGSAWYEWCQQEIVFPLERSTAKIREYTRACPEGYIHTSLLNEFDAAAAPVDTTEMPVEEMQALPTLKEVVENSHECERCVDADPDLVSALMAFSAENTESVRAACSVFREVFSIGALFSAGSSADIATIHAIKLAHESVEDFLPNINVNLRHVPVGVLEHQNATAIRQCLLDIVDAVAQSQPRSGFIWSSGQAALMEEAVMADAEEVAAAVNSARWRESQLMFTWGSTSVSMAPPILAQGSGLLRVVEHFGWNRCILIRGHEVEYQEMGATFESQAAAMDPPMAVLQHVTLPAEGDASRAAALERFAEMDHCRGKIIVLCVGARDAEAVFERFRALEDGGVWSGQWVFLASEEAMHAEGLPPGLLGLRAVAQSDSKKFAQIALHLQSELGEVQAGGLGVLVNASAGMEAAAAAGESAVLSEDVVENSGLELSDDRPYFAYDAYVAMCKALWQMLRNEHDATSEEALRSALMEMEAFPGASGSVKFDGDLRRSQGRFALLNWDGAQWVSLAYWDWEKDAASSGVIVHTVQESLRQSRWEEVTVAWPRPGGVAYPGPKPKDRCDCIFYSQMPEGGGFDVRECQFSLDAVLSTVAVGLLLLCCCGCSVRRCLRRSKGKMDPDEEELAKKVAELRERFHITRRDGYILSSEPQGFRLPWRRELRVLQRAHVEAVAKMAMLMEFDVRAFDAFASCFYSWEPAEQEAQAEKLQQRLDVFKSYSKLISPPGERAYFELRKLLLEVSRELLRPDGVDLSQRAAKNSDAGHSKEEQTSSGSSRSASRGRSSLRSWLWTPSRASEQAAQQRPRNADERFTYFLQYVSKVQMWVEDDHRLFTTLKQVVQELMDNLHDKCDDLFKILKHEHAGADLVAFQWPPADPAALPPPLEGHGPRPDGSHEDPRGPPGVPLPSPPASTLTPPHPRRSSGFAHPTQPPPSISPFGHNPLAPLGHHPLGEDAGVGHLAVPLAAVEAQLVISRDGSTASVGAEVGQQRSFNGAQEGEAVEVVEDIFVRRPPSLIRSDSIEASALPLRKLPRPSIDSLHETAADPPAEEFSYASITRQDHPMVRAIRMDGEDELEVRLQRALPAVGLAEMPSNNAVDVLDEDLYITALRRRALLLNEGFQARVRAAVEHKFGSAPVEVADDRGHAAGGAAAEEAGGQRRGSVTQEQHSRVQAAVRVVERVHGAPVKTKARMREKLFSYAQEAESPRELPPREASPGQGRGAKASSDHPLTANILDPIRCTVVCRGAKEVLEHARWLIDEGEGLGLPVVRVKNKFALEKSDEYDGYRDMMLCVLYTGETGLRIVCEIQIHDVRLHELKLQMHKLYKVKRATAAACI